MPLDRLVERILSDAGKEAERIAEEGREAKEKILEEAYQKAEEKYGAGVREITAIVEMDKERALKAASLEARKELLSEKRRMMSEVFDRAMVLMRNQTRDQCLGMLTDMALDALGQLGADEALMILNDKDRSGMGEEILKSANDRLASPGEAKRLRLSEETREIEGGFVLKAGRVEVDNSFEALIDGRREELEDMVAEILFRNIKL